MGGAQSVVATVALLALLTSCSTGSLRTPTAQQSLEPAAPSDRSASEPASRTPTPRSMPSPERSRTTGTPATADAVVRRVPESQWRRMVEAGMVRPECPIQRRHQLRRVDVNHHDFRGRIRRGHLVVNADVARSVTRIFTRMFDARFPIRRMRSAEAYGPTTRPAFAPTTQLRSTVVDRMRSTPRSRTLRTPTGARST